MAGVVAPPSTFSSRPLVLRTEAVGGVWRRLYPSHHSNPLGFGLALSRFSDPTGRAFGVVYLGSSIKVAFNEVILRDRADGRAGSVPIPLAEIEAYTCAEIEVATELHLIDLTGDGGLKMGVPSDVIGARDQTTAQLWSAAFHAHPQGVDGVYYPSRLNEERNIALYERALPKLKARATPRLIECRDPLAEIINDFELSVV
jgi:hypothetical protein